MPFITVPGIKGMLYVPEAVDISIKKHDCKDCFSCQMCADSRCSVCRGEKKNEALCFYKKQPHP